MTDPKVVRSEAEWRERLTREQFEVTRRGATERPFTGAWLDNGAAGTYRCVCCDAVLFTSRDKYHSGCGWPSFTRPAAGQAIRTAPDDTLGMIRTEVTCARCDAHLGHVFPDGPPEETGQRWCINSASLDFQAKEDRDDR